MSFSSASFNCRYNAPVTDCTPGQNNPLCTSKRSTSFFTASLKTRVETSTAAPIFVMRPKFSICKPFNAFGQSSISPTHKYLSKYRTIWMRDAISYNLSCPSEICTTDCYRGFVSLLDEFNASCEVGLNVRRKFGIYRRANSVAGSQRRQNAVSVLRTFVAEGCTTVRPMRLGA